MNARTISPMPCGRACLTFSLIAALLVVALSAPADAGPKENKRRAARFNDQGMQLFLRKQYREAIASFEKGHALYPEPTLLLNIGRCRKLLSDPVTACAYFNRYSNALPAAGRAAFAPELAKLCPCTFLLRTTPGGVRVKVDGEARGRTGPDGALELAVACTPVDRLVEVGLAGYRPRSERQVPPAPGGRKEITVTLERLPPPSPPPEPRPEPASSKHAPLPVEPAEPEEVEPSDPPEPAGAATPADGVPDEAGRRDADEIRRTKTFWGAVGLGMGAACTIAAVVLYGIGGAEGSAANEDYLATSSTQEVGRYHDEVVAARTKLIAGHVLLGVGVAAFAVATYQMLTRPEQPSQEAASLGAGLVPGGGALVVTGRF